MEAGAQGEEGDQEDAAAAWGRKETRSERGRRMVQGRIVIANGFKELEDIVEVVMDDSVGDNEASLSACQPSASEEDGEQTSPHESEGEEDERGAGYAEADGPSSSRRIRTTAADMEALRSGYAHGHVFVVCALANPRMGRRCRQTETSPESKRAPSAQVDNTLNQEGEGTKGKKEDKEEEEEEDQDGAELSEMSAGDVEAGQGRVMSQEELCEYQVERKVRERVEQEKMRRNLSDSGSAPASPQRSAQGQHHAALLRSSADSSNHEASEGSDSAFASPLLSPSASLSPSPDLVEEGAELRQQIQAVRSSFL